MDFRTFEPVTLASTRTRRPASLRQSSRGLLLALSAVLMFLALAAGLVWWAFL